MFFIYDYYMAMQRRWLHRRFDCEKARLCAMAFGLGDDRKPEGCE